MEATDSKRSPTVGELFEHAARLSSPYMNKNEVKIPGLMTISTETKSSEELTTEPVDSYIKILNDVLSKVRASLNLPVIDKESMGNIPGKELVPLTAFAHFKYLSVDSQR
jgi:hypothetical protein